MTGIEKVLLYLILKHKWVFKLLTILFIIAVPLSMSLSLSSDPDIIHIRDVFQYELLFIAILISFFNIIYAVIRCKKLNTEYHVIKKAMDEGEVMLDDETPTIEVLSWNRDYYRFMRRSILMSMGIILLLFYVTYISYLSGSF